MPKGAPGKGYKMTENRRTILNILVEEGGMLRSKEGRAASLLHGLLNSNGSLTSFNATLRALEDLGFIERDLEGKRTFGISITDKGRAEIGAPLAPDPIEPETIEPEAQALDEPATNVIQLHESSAGEAAPTWDWDDSEPSEPAIPDGIDYEILLGVFLKAALRGMEGPSNSEVEQYQLELEKANQRITVLEAERDKAQAEAAAAVTEKDQLQKNLNVIMSKLDQKSTRRGNPVRSLLTPDEQALLDNFTAGLMRQAPTRRG